MAQFSKYLLFFFLEISLSACSQKKETMINQNSNITTDSIVEEISKQVKVIHQDFKTLNKL